MLTRVLKEFFKLVVDYEGEEKLLIELVMVKLL